MRKKLIAAVIGTSAVTAVAAYDAEAATYRVQAGDSLWSIANKFNISIAQLKSYNGLNSNLIFPDQVLKVSGGRTSTTTQNNRTTGTASGSTYTVRSGDTLSSIAARYGTSYTNIMRLNGLSSTMIYPGQTLKVSGSATPTSTSTPTPTNSGYYSPVFNHSNLYDWGQCTWHVFNKRQAAGKGISTYWWNANAWDDNAARDGYTINNRPAVGSILQTDVGYYGHVAYVERVNADGSILVSEMNYSASPGIMTYRTIPAYSVTQFKYIH